jgi:hypothetical protein
MSEYEIELVSKRDHSVIGEANDLEHPARTIPGTTSAAMAMAMAMAMADTTVDVAAERTADRAECAGQFKAEGALRRP